MIVYFAEELAGSNTPAVSLTYAMSASWKSAPAEHRWVLFFCLVAALRVFIFSAAFPFFNNVDEASHFDLVVKYSEGKVPRSLDFISPESAHYIALYNSPEFFLRPAQFQGGNFPPPLWKFPPNEITNYYQAETNLWQHQVNHEASSAPLYYLAAGIWWQLGKLIGLGELSQLYWLRFLNCFLVVVLVWLGFVAARLIFPERRWLWLGVPGLLAVFPQDTFYSIQSDTLSPLCFGAAFIFLVKWLRAELPTVRLGMILGGCLAATYLTKTSALPLMAVAAVAVLLVVWRWGRAAKLQVGLPALSALVLCAGLPVGGWMWWCQLHFGDLTGSAVKIQNLGWTHKPLADWWSHPLFTPYGAWSFASELLASFWRGEFVWSLQRLASPLMDGFYFISSVLFLGLAGVELFRKATGSAPAQRQALGLGGWCVLAAVGFLALMSLAFDFGTCHYPSRQLPYFTSGRLVTGALIPFVLLYLYGLEVALRRFHLEWLCLPILIGIGLLVMASEIQINAVAFASEYNWFHR